jgi:hypothetical protein
MREELKEHFKEPVRVIFYITIITSAIIHIFK